MAITYVLHYTGIEKLIFYSLWTVLKSLAEMVCISADVIAKLIQDNIVVSPYIGVAEKWRRLEVHELLNSLILSTML